MHLDWLSVFRSRSDFQPLGLPRRLWPREMESRILRIQCTEALRNLELISVLL